MSEEQRKLDYGGQAVMEGVMMRGSQSLAVAVRRPDGEIVMHAEDLDPRIYKGRLKKIPFLRAMISLWDVLVLGVRTLMYSAEVALGPVAEVKFEGPVAWGTVLFSLGLGVLLFFVTPLLLVGVVDPHIPSSFVSNLLEGVIRTGLFIGYVAAIGFVPEIRRVFAYHGAEHKTINAYEAGAALTPASVARFSTSHVRCGTAFMLTVMVISILFFALLGRPPIGLRILSRIVFLPLVAGIAYEYIKFSSRHLDNQIVRLLTKPGLALQKLTTREPEPAMLEVSIAALQRVLEAEGAGVARTPTSAWDKVAEYPGAVL